MRTLFIAVAFLVVADPYVGKACPGEGDPTASKYKVTVTGRYLNNGVPYGSFKRTRIYVSSRMIFYERESSYGDFVRVIKEETDHGLFGTKLTQVAPSNKRYEYKTEYDPSPDAIFAALSEIPQSVEFTMVVRKSRMSGRLTIRILRKEIIHIAGCVYETLVVERKFKGSSFSSDVSQIIWYSPTLSMILKRGTEVPETITATLAN